MLRVFQLNNEKNEEFVILNDNWFKDINSCECFDSGGVQIGCEEAGCNTIKNTNSLYVHNELIEKFRWDKITADTDLKIFQYGKEVDFLSAIRGVNSVLELEKVLIFFGVTYDIDAIEKFLEEIEEHSISTVYNFSDGSSFTTYVFKDHVSEYSDFIEIDENLEKEVLEKYREINNDFDFDKPIETLKNGRFLFSKSRFNHNPWLATVEINN